MAEFDRHLVDNQPIEPDCAYCDKPMSGEARTVGDSRLHQACFDEYGQEMEDADWVQSENETATFPLMEALDELEGSIHDTPISRFADQLIENEAFNARQIRSLGGDLSLLSADLLNEAACALQATGRHPDLVTKLRAAASAPEKSPAGSTATMERMTAEVEEIIDAPF